MKTIKNIAAATFAIAAIAAPLAAAASDGDIVDIRAVDVAGSMTFGTRNSLSPYKCTVEHPLVVGDTLYIRVRLLVRNWHPTWKAGADPQTWTFKAGALGQSVLYPAKLGLFVGDRPVYAEYSEYGPNSWQRSGELQCDDNGTPTTAYRYYTDLYFAYDVQPGDIGLPVTLMNSSGEKASSSDDNKDYFLLNCDTLGLSHNILKDTLDNVVGFHFGPETLEPDWPATTDVPVRSFDLTAEGVFVKTVDFDAYPDDAHALAGIWRDVYPGMSDPPGTLPAIETADKLAAVANTTVWVWSEDESIVVPYGGATQPVTYYDEHSVLQTRQGLPVTISVGASMATFHLKGGDSAAVGAETNICISTSRTPTYTSAGAAIQTLIRRKVKIVEVPAPTVSLRLDGTAATKTVTANDDYVTCNTKLAVKMTPTCPSDVTIALNAAVSGDDTLDAIDKVFDQNILRIADGSYSGDPLSEKKTSVTIPANTSVVYLNLYVLGGTAKTGTKGVTFSATKTSGPADVVVSGGCTLKVNRSTPEILPESDPAPGADVTVMSGGFAEFSLALADSYRDLNDTATGYTFKWSCEGEDIDDETGVVMDGDGRFTASAQFWSITEGKELTLQVVSPDGTKSLKATYNLVVTDSKKTTVAFADPSQVAFGEGDSAYLNLGISQPYKGTSYVFIDADDPAALANITTTLTTDGAQIPSGYTSAAMPREISFNDGTKGMTLKAVLCSLNDPTKKVTTYTASTISFTVTNKPPTFVSAVCAGTPMQPSDRNSTITVPRGVAKTFSLTASDVAADLDATGDDAFQVKWSIDGKEYVTKGNPAGQLVTNTFENVKTGAKVYVYLKDKDMLTFPASPNFYFNVNVTEKPRVKISTSAVGGSDIGGTITEDSSGETITVALSDAASTNVTVRLTIQQTGDGGYVRLREVAGMVEAVEPGKYDVKFSSGALTRTARIAEMDGTDGTRDGLEISAEVITEDANADGVRWKDFYSPAETYLLVVLNASPQIKRPSEDEVASTNFNASANTPYLINYSATDVVNDLTNGLSVAIEVDNTTVMTTNVVDSSNRTYSVVFDGEGAHSVTVKFHDKDETTFVASRTQWFYVRPAKRVQLRAHGPAGAVATPNGYSEHYARAAGLGAGRVYIGDNGPQRVRSFVHYYSFTPRESAVPAYAFGYLADTNRWDDGKLVPAPDKSISAAGNWEPGQVLDSTNCYNYALQHKAGIKGLDSFVYAWACNNTQTAGGGSGGGVVSFAVAEPLLFNMGPQGEMNISLPAYSESAAAYEQQFWEAIFSREFLATDNCGDINADRIPDVCVYKYGLGVIDVLTQQLVGGDGAGDDLADISGYNEDVVTSGGSGGDVGDFLPTGGTSAFGTLIPELPSGWSENPFTAVLEIRGYGQGLNDAMAILGFADVESDRLYAEEVDGEWKWTDNCSINELEFSAWRNYAAAHGLVWSNKVDWAKWSPERPTDPTLDDTDDDGLPDGYEYYIWYRAHVGYMENGVHKYMTGRRFDPKRPDEGRFISAAAVARAFDPRSKDDAVDFPADSDGLDLSTSELNTRDIDNDGLPDLLELWIGTNPVDFDSDGDGLPDGFEVLVAATDPLTTETTRGTNDAKRNYDGDAMAFTTPKAEKAMKEPPSKNVKSLSKFALVDANGDGDGVQWYVIPTDDVATNLDYAASGAGYIVKVGEVEYVTTNRPATVERDGGVFLAADLPLDSTWTTGSFIDTNGVNQLIQLMPTRIVAGTKLAAAPDMTTTNFGHVVYLTKVAGSMAAWTYGRGDSFGFLVPGRYKDAPEGTAIAAMPEVDDTIAYIHYYVYQEFGFDPRTAWKASSPLAKRWGDPDLLSYAGNPTRTRWYTLYDEFLVMTFFYNGLDDRSKMDLTPTKSNPWHAIWSRYTTNGRGPDEPGLSNDEHYTGRTPINGSPDENGADTDADGVPDGWELYVMAGPKTIREVNGVEKEFFRILPPYDDNGLADLGPFVAQAKNKGATGKDGDDLSEYQEFAGTDTTAYYKDLSTTVDNPHDRWLNKFFPCDPWNADTDGDGIDDKEESSKIGRRGEYHGFIYGTPVDNGKLISIPGGGLNPCSVDTDLDGLPDEWEMQYNGSKIYSGAGAEYAGSDAGSGNPLQGLVDGMDGTVPDAFNVVNGALDAASGAFKTTTLRRTYEDGTRRMFGYVDRDYDNDGLENWQEYIIGTMRCWRYDDPLTPWDSIPEAAYWDELGNFAPQYAALGIDTTAGDGGVGEFWYRTLVDTTSPLYNPRLVSGQTTGAMYFSRVTNPWDPASRVDKVSGECCSFYYFRGKVDGVSLASLWGSAYASITGRSAPPLPPAKYISCSPLRADTDGDGMDDYYELFHGMNPLLGASGAEQSFSGPCDIVSDAWLGAFEAWNADNPAANAWTFRAARGDVAQGDYYKTGRKPRGTGYDFEYFPWLNGLATADPDGDDVRNQDESIMPKIGTTTWLHTDPTPLWMTDSGYSRSLTRMYFRMPGRDRGVPTPGDTFEFEGVTYRFSDFAGWTPGDGSPYFISYSQDQGWLMYGAGAMNWICSFEENEGYDSDHDAMSDSHEADGKLRSASDPQDANSPDRRQAMYFAGPANPSALQLPPEVAERYPVTGDIWPDEPAFLEFTVEAWVFAESLADATVVERAIWCDEAKAGDEEYVRKNFQLGVKGGKWFAKYDVNGTLARGEVKITSTADAEVGKWHHLAATYNGSRFVLYVDGEPAAPAVDSSRKPEYGGSAMVLRRTKSASGAYEKFSPGDYWYDDEYALTPIVVGASLKTKAEGGSADAFDVRNAKGWGFYDGFFTGYIDEVRIWDGARGVDDIRADYRARRHYTVEAAAENRSAFYTEWTAKGSRYGKDESGNSVSIVPELRYLFTFDSVPGGVDDQVTAKVPAGFDYYQPAMFGDPERGAAVLSRPEDWSVAWWTNVVAAYGSVYSSGSWVQWVPNTMAHLPRFDGTTLDSFYWSDNTCGDANGTYSFARTAEPASRWTQLAYNGVTNDGEYSAPGARHHLICRLDGIQSASTNSDDSAENEVRTYSRDRFNQFRFAGRNSLVDGLDLLPLGGAYPKAFPNTAEGGMWDEQGASTQSELTSDDANFNDLPDTWEEYARGNYSPESSRISWDTMVTWNGRRMTAGEAYRLDLAAGLVVAADAYGTLDVIQRDDLAQAADQDGSLTPDWWDDLYGIYNESVMADSDNDGLSNYAEYLVTTEQGIVLDPKNAMSDSKTLDYFRKVGSMYLGEMYADHDFIRDSWEDIYDVSFVNRNVYDAHSDPDGDGWSNYAESRAGSRPDKGSALVFEDVVGEYPVPSIRIKAVYSGVSTGAPVVVKAYSGDSLGAPDAVWTISPDGEASTQVRLLGMNSGGETTIGLGPGSVVAGSVYVEFRDPNECEISADKTVWTNPMNSQWRTGMSEMTIAGDSQHSRLGFDDDLTFGEVDYTKGTATIRLSAVPRYKYHDGDNYTYYSELLNPSNTYVRVDTTKSYVRAVWQSRYVPEDGGWSFVLSKADSGHVREGLNTFMVFCDTDGNGEYTVGEPLGIVRDVNVGWDATPEVLVQLTDEAVAGARFAVAAQSNATTRVRVVRTAVNGAACKPRAAYARTLDLRAGKTFTEVDLMKAGEWDFDWKNLVSDAAADGVADVASAEYTVYLGYGQTEPVATFTRTFGGSFVKPAPSGTYADSGYIVHSARPTLAWKASAGYPTFALQIAADADFNEVVYATTNLMPGVTAEGCRFTPDIYVGDGLLDGTNYFWRVAQLNSKFTMNVWSDVATFRTEVDSSKANTGYGKLAAEIRYYGPSTKAASNVVVGVYGSADFACEPVARMHLGLAGTVQGLTNDLSKAFTAVSTNVCFDGIAPGRYYVMAFIDSNTNGVRDAWESWGYANKVGYESADPYAPVSLEVTSSNAKIDSAYIIMEDTDVNQNKTPDCIEDMEGWTPPAAVEVATRTDSDGDGLTDAEEGNYLGTDPYDADTDGDGMPDGWEYWNGVTDALNADGEIVASGDVMAYAEERMTVIVLEDDTPYAITAAAAHTPAVGDSVAGLSLATVYRYGVGDNAVWAFGTNLTASVAGRIVSVEENVPVALMHAQVYARYGFDSRTCVPEGTVNTKEFTALDKYLVGAYFQAIGVTNVFQAAEFWENWTLKPGDPDNNRDGVPDGWELYLMFGTNTTVTSVYDMKVSPFPVVCGMNAYDYVRNDTAVDQAMDGDGLSIIREYNGGVAPTDPWLKDTNGDGIDDKTASEYGIRTPEVRYNDDDNDGLDNFTEYLVNEVFDLGITLSPTNSMSDGETPDYFRKVGLLYLGEMLTDHDHMEDWWEKASGGRADPSVWDAQLDPDESGWSNYAVRRSMGDAASWVEVGTRTNFCLVTYGYPSPEDEIFLTTNAADIVTTEFFDPSMGWLTNDVSGATTLVRYTLAVPEPIMVYGGHPKPVVDMTVYYNGKLLGEGKTMTLVVKAYSDDDMMVADAVFTNTVKRGVNKLTLHEPASGMLKEGRNHFMAYMVANSGDSSGGSGSKSGESSVGEYEPGQPFGVVRDVDVGWNSARAVIELSETSAVADRIKLWESEMSDRVVSFGLSQPTNKAAVTIPAAPNVRVRVLCVQIDDNHDASNLVDEDRIIMDRIFNAEARDYIHEGDFLGNGNLDIDWATFEEDVVSLRPYFANLMITNVAYAIVFGDGSVSRVWRSNDKEAKAHPLLITRRFEKTHTPPTAVIMNGDSVCRTAQPTFRWKIEGEDPWASAYGTTYTAFRVKVWDKTGGTEVYDSGYQRMPVADSTGVYSWTAPLYVDRPSPSGAHAVFSNLCNYTWSVFTYNAKFKTDDVGSVKQTFRMNVTDLDTTSYGIGLNVVYAGPASDFVNHDGSLHVQAFETPDFTGYPVAEAVVTNATVDALSSATGAQARIAGLKAGTYYLRAYIDTDYDWTFDDWESWGYLSERDVASADGTASIFNPVSATVGPSVKGEPARTIYIEDRDTDGDGFPDAWEAERNGNVFDPGFIDPVEGDTEFIAVNTNLVATLTSLDVLSPDKKTLINQIFGSTSGAAYGIELLTGVKAGSAKRLAAGSFYVPASVAEESVAIRSLDIDRQSGEVVLRFGAETDVSGLDPTGAAAAASVYDVAYGAEVTVKVYRTETLAGEWQLVAEENMVITSSDGGQREVRAPLPQGVDAKSGFFKVEIEQ